MSRSSPLPSPIGEKAAKSDVRPAKRRHFKHHLAASLRWLHIYLSMFGLGMVLFFGVTGITLNHPDWAFGGSEVVVQVQGKVETRWLNPDAGKSEAQAGTDSNSERPVMKLEIVEHLRKEHDIRGALTVFKVDDAECMVTFKGPGYSADAFINRESGQYNLTESRAGFMAVINDLHKGRDTGKAWAVVIDISAGLMVVISLTGFALLFYIKRRRVPGIFIGLLGTIALLAAYWFWVP